MEKTERFGFWLTTTEKTLIIRLAEIEGGLSLAALIRRLVREAAQKHGILSIELVNAKTEPKGVDNA